MDKVLYDLMDWAAIEELVYSEAAEPQNLLGPHLVEEGLLIQAFMPTAVSMTVKLSGTGKSIPWRCRMRQVFLPFCCSGRIWQITPIW